MGSSDDQLRVHWDHVTSSGIAWSGAAESPTAARRWNATFGGGEGNGPIRRDGKKLCAAMVPLPFGTQTRALAPRIESNRDERCIVELSSHV